MSTKRNIIVLSDIHIGDNTPTCWYQKSFHEPYLIAALDWVIENAATTRELVLLGDLVDFWTYPPDITPPTFQAIMDANPNIFGPSGKLSQVLTALDGKVSYLHGNHDIDLRQNDLNLIQNPQGYTITLQDDIYYPLAPSKTILCTHGHLFTMFNAPDRISRLNTPVGHFVTRAVAYLMHNTLQAGQTVADIKGNGAPSEPDFSAIIEDIIRDPDPVHIIMRTSLPLLLLESIRGSTKIPLDQVVRLSNGRAVTYGEAEQLYNELLWQWVQEGSQGSNIVVGLLYAMKSAKADQNGDYMAWFAQRLAYQTGARLVVTGHTHLARIGIHRSKLRYLNCGYECSAIPDIETPLKHFNFGLINSDVFDTQIRQVKYIDDHYIVIGDEVGSDALTFSPAEDFSCYIQINNNLDYAWTLSDFSLGNGYYVVPPPQRISPHETARFWGQDYPGIHGVDGKVVYTPEGSSSYAPLHLSFDCPTGLFPNVVTSDYPFRTSVGDEKHWQSGTVSRGGHPLLVEVDLNPSQ